MTSNLTDMEKQPLLDEQQEPEQELSLSELQENIRKAQRAYFQAWSKTSSGKWHKRLMLAVAMLVTTFFLFCFGVIMMEGVLEDDDWHPLQRVPLEAHIMSKCPDAKDCLHDMILPAMQNVSHKVDFKLSYIGEYVQHNGSDSPPC